jgi:hypothetical protein
MNVHSWRNSTRLNTAIYKLDSSSGKLPSWAFRVSKFLDPIHPDSFSRKLRDRSLPTLGIQSVDLVIGARIISTAVSETIPNFLERKAFRHKMSRNKCAQENGDHDAESRFVGRPIGCSPNGIKRLARVGELAPLKSERSPDEGSVFVPGGAIGVETQHYRRVFFVLDRSARIV